MLYVYYTVIIAILYVLFDVNYFLRIIFTILWSRFFAKKKKLFDTTTNYGICSIQDVNLVLRMNNARYLRELDFARSYFYDNSKIFAAITKRGSSALLIVQSATTIQYRRALPIFTLYKITTKLIYWEGKNFYIEQQFINLMDNFICAITMSRQTVIGLKVLVEDIIAEIEPGTYRPEPTKELRLWLEYMEASSQNLKKQK